MTSTTLKLKDSIMISPSNAIEVLLIEDNPGDVRLISETLKDSKLLLRIRCAYNGSEALAMLQQQGSYVDHDLPDLILLDLNLPQMSGHEILRQLKTNDTLKRIPVVILTSSAAEADIVKAYDLHANCYITKPVNLNSFIEVVNSIENFWFTIAKLPTAAS
jgi:CheY-like chemotaxis protein